MKDQLEGGSRAAVQPVSYALGRTRSTKMVVTKHRNVVMLTGANSGGKTTLLTTLASIHILTLLGLPVPCERAEVAPIPIYLFRRRVTRKIGSLEQALSSLIPVFADRHRKLVLMDEFEALTEPGAAGRILAGIMNTVATGSSLLLLVTHLARETLPHVKLPIRVDGIEAEGLDKDGDLIVDRQPKFNHIGSSTPKLIIMKLSKAAKKSDKALYGDILNSLEGESSVPVQTPLNLPWLSKEDA
jgi:dsDNA-specific endonuclease/ATPase MutS2